MKQDRLDDVMLPFMEQKFASTVDVEDIIDYWEI